MKKTFLGRLITGILVLMTGVVFAFAELGVATAFDMRFNGLSYMEYAKAFYSVPWHFVAGIIIVALATVILTEIAYSDYLKLKEN